MHGGLTLSEINDLDFLTFDDVLKVALQVDAANRLALFRIFNHGAQGGGDDNKALINDLLKQAYPEKGGDPTSSRPNQGIGGLRKFLSDKGAAGKKAR